ncbi:MAG: hypothetical protein KTR30_19805 [Saprospiraceae bacterium]|nr:hypothetical protein [Saprospiraceae bacterium]
MTKSNLQLKHLKKSVSHGNIRQVIDELIEFTEGSATSMTTEIYHVAARYRQLEAEKLRGHIALQDYKLEYNSITFTILEIIDQIQHSAIGTFQQVCPMEQIRKELAMLSKQFEETNAMRSLASNFRMKIHIARKMAEKLIPWPKLILEYQGTKDQAMICAIGRKVKILAEVTDLDILETIVPNAKSDLVKGFLTNALVELIYAGQLRWGDEERIQAMLNTMQEGAEEVLLTNIIRVQATLDVVTRHVK